MSQAFAAVICITLVRQAQP